MRHVMVMAGLVASFAIANYAAFAPATVARWGGGGPPFACGAGPNTGAIGWDASIPEPGATKAAVTGVLSTKKDKKDAAAQTFTIDELKNGRPLMVYRYLDGSMDASLDSYKFSQAFEVKILAKPKIIAHINAKWWAKRSPIGAEADQKKKQNQAAIVFYAFTGEKLGRMDSKSRMSSRNFLTKLKKFEAKNKALCAKEIKRLEQVQKAKAKAEAEAKKRSARK